MADFFLYFFFFLLLSCEGKILSTFLSSVLFLFPGLAICFESILDLSYVWLKLVSFNTSVSFLIICFFKETTLTLAVWHKNASQSLKCCKSIVIFWPTNSSTGTDIYNPAVGGHLLLRAALWRKSQINSWFFSSTKGFLVFFFGRWTMLYSVMSMWWELHRLQEWNQRCFFGLLWHMFTCYRDPSMIVSIKHIKHYKLLKRLDKQGTASAKEKYVKEKGGTTRTSSIRLKKGNVPICWHSAADRHEACFLFFLLQLKSQLLKTSRTEH